jgi:hypothetical protein
MHAEHRASNFSRNGNIYDWSINTEGGGFRVWLYPVGVDIYYGNTILKTDKTRVRLNMGHDPLPDPENYYYRESEFSVTHITSDNLRIRADQNLSSATIKILEKGTMVQVQRWGNYASIDGNNARWAYVITINGIAGWCYSGYLKEQK